MKNQAAVGEMIANAENQEKAARKDLAEFMDLVAESLSSELDVEFVIEPFVPMNPTDKKIAEIQAGLLAMREIARNYGFFPVELIAQVEAELAELVHWRLLFVESERRCHEERKSTK